MTRKIIIGDIHGCYAELIALLDAVAPAADDQVIALGDIVDRGPDSEKVLAFFRSQPNAVSLIGNHERKHIRSARGEVRPAPSQKIVKQQLGDRYAEWLVFMERFPRHIELPEALLVHGFLEQGIPLEEQLDTVVIGTLTGEKRITGKCADPWYDHYTGPKPLIVGHHSYLRNGEPVIREGLFYGIDTGCAHGGRLTALILPEFRIVSVPSQADHWAEQQGRYAVMAASSKDDLDLDWKTLQTYAQAFKGDHLSQERVKRAKQCAEILVASQGMVGRICEAATGLSQAILDELSQDNDWKSLAPKKRVSRYAQRVQEHPQVPGPLLHRARQGRLEEGMIYRVAKTPRELLHMAADLGVAVNRGGALDQRPREDDSCKIECPSDGVEL